MRLIRLGEPGSERPAALLDGDVFDLAPLMSDLDGAFLDAGGIERARAELEAGRPDPLVADGVRIGAPVARPGKIVCIGLNYRDHAAETGAEPPTEPTVFLKAHNTFVGPDDEVLIPRAWRWRARMLPTCCPAT